MFYIYFCKFFIKKIKYLNIKRKYSKIILVLHLIKTIMSKTELSIINLMQVLYKISDNEKNKLIESFKTTTDNEKQEILVILWNTYNKQKKSLNKLFTNIKRSNNKINEFIEIEEDKVILENLIK